MVIKRRDIKTKQTTDKGWLRHPMLKHGSVHYLVYNFIKSNPMCRGRDFHHITFNKQPLSDLVNEGLVIGHGEIPRQFTIVPENETSRPRDKVEVKIVVYVNKFGEYSIKADMTGQRTTAHEDFPQEVAARVIHIPIPFPDDPYAIREIVDVNERTGNTGPQEKEPVFTRQLIIDGDCTIIPPD